MKILLVDVCYNQGSTGKIVHDQREQYLREGHEVMVCYGRGPLRDDSDVHRIAPPWEVHLHALLTRLTGLVGYFSPVATQRFLRLIRQFKPDVVHLHELHGYYVNFRPVVEYLKRNNIKTVWTFHCEIMFTGKCGHSYECERWRTGCGRCPQKREYPKSLFFDRTHTMWKRNLALFKDFHSLTITPVARWLARKCKESPIVGHCQIQVVHNGINTAAFAPQNTSELRRTLALDDGPVAVHVTPDFNNVSKGGATVLEMARRLPHVTFLIVGVREPIPDCPANARAITRTQSVQELAAYYSLGDIFLMTSKAECLPTVCLEALCCGTPVVGFFCDGTREAAPEPYGHLVPYGDLDLLQEAVEAALFGTQPLPDSAACASFGRDAYNKERMVQDYMALYQNDSTTDLEN